MQPDFQHAVALVTEQVEGLLDVVEAEVVRDEGGQIDAVVFNHCHQPTHPLLATGAERRDDLLIA